MENEPVASIVIPTFNRSGLVSKAIDSALSQTINCEVIVCDHGSTDNTPEVARRYGDRIKYIRRECDSGPFYMWLDGILHATTQYVHLTYDDDWIEDTFMERCLSIIDDDVGLVYTAVEMHMQDGESIVVQKGRFKEGKNKSRLLERKMLDSSLTISPGCGLFRKKDMIQAILYGWGTSEKEIYRGAGADALIYLFPLCKYPYFGFADEILAHYRMQQGSITVDAGEKGEVKELQKAYKDSKEAYVFYRYMRFSVLRKLLLLFRRIRLVFSIYILRPFGQK